jgi:hypothetical protein
MGFRMLASLNLLIVIIALAGCVYFPPSYTGSELNKADDEIGVLLENHASKREVIKRLGTPLKYRDSSLSYVACLDRARWVSDVSEQFLKPECFELKLEFNHENCLTNYQQLPWFGEFDFNEEELKLRELARYGDPLAHQLWQQMDRNGISEKHLDKIVERGNDEIYLDMYWEDPGDTNALRWLCRAADKENTKAQYRLGLLYEMGIEDVPKDPVRAYMWYRLAASRGDYIMASEQAKRLHEQQTTEQVTRAEYLIQEWKPGQCEQELLHNIPHHENQNMSEHLLLKDIDLFCPKAELGNTDAQTYIGDLYYVGSYGLFDKDLIQAYVWYSLASKNGNSYAALAVEKVKRELTPEQLLSAKDRLEKWEPGQCRIELLRATSINGQ